MFNFISDIRAAVKLTSKVREAHKSGDETRVTGILDLSPTFCMKAPDKSLSRLGLSQGDMLFCDRELSPARFVIAEWDNLAHICTQAGQILFDEEGQELAPESAVMFGRVLYVARALIPPDEEASG